MDFPYISTIILSLFCAVGLFAYVREVRSLQHLVSSGMLESEKILKNEKIDSGSESVAHYLVTYKYVDAREKTVTNEQDLNSYPFSHVHAVLKISKMICAAIISFLTILVLIFIEKGS